MTGTGTFGNISVKNKKVLCNNFTFDIFTRTYGKKLGAAAKKKPYVGLAA